MMGIACADGLMIDLFTRRWCCPFTGGHDCFCCRRRHLSHLLTKSNITNHHWPQWVYFIRLKHWIVIKRSMSGFSCRHSSLLIPELPPPTLTSMPWHCTPNLIPKLNWLQFEILFLVGHWYSSIISNAKYCHGSLCVEIKCLILRQKIQKAQNVFNKTKIDFNDRNLSYTYWTTYLLNKNIKIFLFDLSTHLI